MINIEYEKEFFQASRQDHSEIDSETNKRISTPIGSSINKEYYHYEDYEDEILSQIEDPCIVQL